MQNPSMASAVRPLNWLHYQGAFSCGDTAMKTCPKCRRSLTVDNFHKNAQKKDGLHGWCKVCSINASNAWNKAHREECRERDTKYYAAHRDEQREYAAKWGATHREKQRGYKAKYNAGHRAERRRHSLKRRYAESLNKGQSYAAWEREIRSKKTFVCYWCGQKKPLNKLHIDHIVPISKGGADCLNNVTTSCVGCNLTKHNKDLKKWAPTVGMLAF